jgi:glycosyltransferase involved in cell wall biosynthesis
MKIAYDHQVFSFQRHGGISRYVVELVQNLLHREDIEPTVIAPVHINEYLRRPGIRERVRGSYLPLAFRGGAKVVGLLNSALLPLFWKGREFDIVHETYYSKALCGRGRVRILTIHDLIHEQFPQDFPDTARVIAAKRAAAERADHIICVSENTRRDAIRLLGIGHERTSVIHLGYSLGFQHADSPGRYLAPCVLYVGQRGGYKNFEVLLEAFASSPKLRQAFDLVAFGGRSFSTEEQSRIHALGFADRVRQVGGDDALLNAYYRAAVAFVYPSRYEGFGIPPLEAMATGCPVACSNAGSLREVVGPAGAYFDPDDREGLREILERLTDDAVYADELRAKGFEQIKKYSWARCAAETLQTYQRLAGRVG